MTMFRHDHGMIMARSCHGSHVFPTRVEHIFWPHGIVADDAEVPKVPVSLLFKENFGSFETKVLLCEWIVIMLTQAGKKFKGNRIDNFNNFRNLKIAVSRFHESQFCLLESTKNKTAGNHRHIFHPPIFSKIPFKRMKTFFFSKIFHHIFSNFSKFTKFLILCRKIWQLRWMTFLGNKSFDTHSTASLPPFTNLKKNQVFLEKKHLAI